MWLGTAQRPMHRCSCRFPTSASITTDGIYKCVLAYAEQAKISVDGFGVHSLRATAATNALEHEADTAKVQEWLGHANISHDNS